MLEPYYADPDVTLHVGDALETVRQLPTGHADSIVTSPPYFGLRDYGHADQWGLEPTVAEYVAKLTELLDELRRVLTPTGTLWLNLGDTYAGKANAGARTTGGHGHHHALPGRSNTTADAPYKSLIGVPWRVALAAVDTGWTLRNAIVWAKPNGMPTSVPDRLRTTYEHVFLLTTGPRYHFDLGAIRVPSTSRDKRDGQPVQRVRRHRRPRPNGHDDLGVAVAWHPDGKNPGDVWDLEPDPGDPGDLWTISTEPSDLEHYALMPKALARRCILAGTPIGGMVLDPFAGACTTGVVARQLGRRFTGVELHTQYLDLAVPRFAEQPLFHPGAP